MNVETKRQRVLVWGLTNSLAGTEAVIKNYVGAIGNRVAFDFLLFEEPTNYQELFQGENRYFVIPNKRTNPRGYFAALREHFEHHAGEYVAVWSNLNILNNIDVLKYGARYGIPHRILHAHNSHDDGNLHQRLLCMLHKYTFESYLTDRWACSKEAGDYFFGEMPYEVLPNAIDETRVRFSPEKRAAIRTLLGVSSDQRVVGAVGRLTYQKNYEFLLGIWPSVVERCPDARLVIVGSGELEQDLKAQAKQAGIEDSVVFTGVQTDIQAYLSAFDVYVMPSHYEGLPISLLEAQFNGLGALVSDAVSEEAIISPALSRLSLDDPEPWVRGILEAQRLEGPLLERADTYRISMASDRVATAFEKFGEVS